MMNVFGASDIGLRRKQNQDSYGIITNDKKEYLAVVCDGIGGGLAGDVASKIAVDHLRERFLKKPELQNDQDVKYWLKQSIQEANDLIFMQSANVVSQKGMGTTCVGVLVSNTGTYIFNVGDSRIYGLYDESFIALTEDHSFVQDLIRAGEISEEEAKTHPNRNMLTNALGIWDTVKVDINKIKPDYQMLLICSDGLHGYVEEHEILTMLKSGKKLPLIVEDLINASKQAGGYDNVSVILMQQEAGDSCE